MSDLIPIPVSIKIGGFDYAVSELSHKEAETHGIDARVDFYDLTIKVRGDMHMQHFAERMLHETLHGIWDAAHLGETEDEETVVTRLSKGLFQVLRDNPQLVTLVTQAGTS